MTSSIHRVYLHFAILTIFLSGFVSSNPGSSFYYYYLLVPVFLAFGIYGSKFRFSKKLILIVVGFVTYAVILALINQNLLPAVGQIAGIVGMLFFYYFSITNSERSTEQIIKLYLKYAFFISLVAYVEFGSFLMGFEQGYDLSWIIPKWGLYISSSGIPRVHSILPEPAHYIHVLAPAISISLIQIVNRRSQLQSFYRSLAILGTIFLNLSSLSFITIFLVTFFILIKERRVYTVILSIFVVATLFTLYQKYEPLKLRVDSIITLFAGNYVGYGNDENFSALTLYNHSQISWNVFLDTYSFGGGLKTHKGAYDKYSLVRNADIEGWNEEDANSLVLRLISELGIFWCGLFIYLIARISKPDISVSWSHAVIGVSIAIFLIVYGLRQGHYFVLGLEFFVLLGLKNYREYRFLLKTESLRIEDTDKIEPIAEF